MLISGLFFRGGPKPPFFHPLIHPLNFVSIHSSTIYSIPSFHLFSILIFIQSVSHLPVYICVSIHLSIHLCIHPPNHIRSIFLPLTVLLSTSSFIHPVFHLFHPSAFLFSSLYSLPPFILSSFHSFCILKFIHLLSTYAAPNIL